MRYRVRYGERIIGHSDLETYLPAWHTATGVLYPTGEYDTLRPFFRAGIAAAVADEEIDSERSSAMTQHAESFTPFASHLFEALALGLEVLDADGTVVSSESVYIADFTAVTSAPHGLQLAVRLPRDVPWRPASGA